MYEWGVFLGKLLKAQIILQLGCFKLIFLLSGGIFSICLIPTGSKVPSIWETMFDPQATSISSLGNAFSRLSRKVKAYLLNNALRWSGNEWVAIHSEKLLGIILLEACLSGSCSTCLSTSYLLDYWRDKDKQLSYCWLLVKDAIHNIIRVYNYFIYI